MSSKLKPNTTYTATLQFTSIGTSNAVVPHVKWSHEIEPDSAEDIPASYQAMAEIIRAMQADMVPYDGDTDALPENPEERAAMILAAHEARETTKN